MNAPNPAPPAIDAGPGINPAILRTVASKVREGQCILFLGAGVHSTPPDNSPYRYSKKKSPPRGRALSRFLARKSQYAEAFPGHTRYSLPRVSLHFEMELGRNVLIDELDNAVNVGKEPSPALRALAELNFPLVITTNYDQLFERALTDAGKPQFTRGVYSPNDHVETLDIEEPDAERPYILKIHGDIQDPRSIVITDEDYIQFVLRMSDKEQVNPVPLGLKFYLKKWPTLFVGYSLMDYNLRLLFKTLRWRVDRGKFPISYAVDPFPDPLLVRILSGREQHISFIASDVWNFVPALYQAVKGREMPQ